MAYSSYKGVPSRTRSNSNFSRRTWRRKKLRFLGAVVTGGFIIFIAFVLLSFVAFGIFATTLPSPDKLTNRDIEQSTKIYDRHGELLYDIYGNENRTLVQLGDIPDSMKKATIAIEDKNFYEHRGFDPLGILRSIPDILFERKLVSGSTLTQQLVKNALLSSEQTITRKAKEFILAIEIENKYSKDEILQIYLNEIPYGGTAWGVEAASNLYFNKHTKDLTLAESAILAGLPQSPSRYSPFGTDPKAYISRTEDVLRRMREEGFITEEEETRTKEEIASFKFAEQRDGIKAPHFSLYVRELLVEKFGEEKVLTGGLRVTTSLDLKMQEAAQKVVADEVNKAKNLKVGNGAAVVQDAKTGEILAMVGSKDYFAEDYDGNVNVTLAERQPGSSIKPVNYVTGFKNGYTASTMLLDVRTVFPGGAGQKDYIPVNYDGRDHGPQQIRYALGNSYNIPAVKMLKLNGVPAMIQTAKDMGINTFDEPERYGLSLTLGGGEVKLLELTNAYSVFANGGKRVDPVAILKITDSKGKVVDEFKPTDGRQVLRPEHAFLISDILSDKNAKLAAFGGNAVENILSVRGKTVAVKTGTTDDKKDNWTVGYSPSYTVGVWVGNNDGTPMDQRLSSGITGAAPIWRGIIGEVLKDKNNETFNKPSGIVQMEVDKISGLLPGPGTGGDKRFEYFAKDQVPTKVDDMRRSIRICKLNGLPADPGCESTGQVEERGALLLYDPFVKQCSGDCSVVLDGGGVGAPNIVITRPSHEQQVGYTFTVDATISSGSPVTQADFYLDDTLLVQDTAEPFTAQYKVDASVNSGPHVVRVRATNSSGITTNKEILVNLNPSL
jgi:1A family penicillin-binding protein